MPPRRTASPALGPAEVEALVAALAAGKRPTVYLRDGVPSLGVAPATSARVVSVDGSTVTVRPRGIGDDVPFEAAELAGSAAAAARPTTPAPRQPRAPRVRAGRPGPAPRAVKPVSVTLTGSVDGWTVEVGRGSGRARPVAVPAEAVGRAVQALGDPAVSSAVGAVLEHARRTAEAQVSALSDQLARARATLDALS